MTTPGETAKLPAIPMAATIVLVGILASIYVLSQFFRNSIGVIAPDLAAELHLSASEIGLLSSSFFFAFAAAQIPLGISIDRYGPKICMLVCAAVTIGGAVLFAFAKSPAGLIAARVLMGAGSSCYLMAPLALYARRYPAERFATLVGIQLGLGSIGTLLATAPLAFAAAAIGWRQTFVVAAILMGLIAAVVAAAVHDDHRGGASQAHRESLREGIGGLVEVLRMPYTFVSGLIFGAVYERRRNLLPSMIAHATNNLLGFIALVHAFRR